MSSSAGKSLVEQLNELLASNPPGRAYKMGSAVYVMLTERVFVIIGDGWMEVTVCTPHEKTGDCDVEEAAEKSILEDFRVGLGARLMERGWREIRSGTTETTLSDSNTSSMTVTEVVCRVEIQGPEAILEEIQWLVSRSVS